MGKLNEIFEIDVVYRRPPISSMVKVNSCEDVVKLFRDLITEEKIDLKEFFLVALLNRKHSILGISCINIGSTCLTAINVKEILQLAIKTNSSAVIMCHNHPSGNLDPSENDIAMTRSIRDVCKICEITLLDHIILTQEGYCSFIDRI